MNTEDTSLQSRPELSWFTSSYSSGAGGECVEVAVEAAAVHVRDSKRATQGGPELKVSSGAWSALLDAM
ncbi:DUF397 domain-containing protein [Streptomyces sp. NRRL WC-3626]|uniref:DUF397 domain-containing protein n=1 Tax=Streptomyces sp. NRRL WC-3626 TaxID=1463926 RepID=UPI0004C258BD|nr:DUF397 domain-containing protein [Streptomyces sp. NRRL WC-3626]